MNEDITLDAPATASGFSHAGVEYDPTGGSIDVPQHVVPHALAHGYTVQVKKPKRAKKPKTDASGDGDGDGEGEGAGDESGAGEGDKA